MFRTIRLLSEALQGHITAIRTLGEAMDRATDSRPSGGELADRVTAIELSLAKSLAEMEALVLTAKGQYRSAAAAEGRAKTREDHASKLVEGGEDGPEDFHEAYQAYLDRGNGVGSPQDGMHGVSGVVAETPVGRAAVRAQVRARRRG